MKKRLFGLFLVLLAVGVGAWGKSSSRAEENNLVVNPSFEEAANNQPVNWAKGRWGTNTTVFSYPVTGMNSPRAARVEITGHSTGDAKWYFQEVPVVGGQQYLFTDYYQANVPTIITARYLLANGAYRYPDLATLPASESWTQARVAFTVPSDAVAMTIFHLINRVGYLNVDEYDLETAVATPTATPPPLTPTPTPAVTATPSPTSPTPSPNLTPTPTPAPVSTESLVANYSVEIPKNPNTPVGWSRGGYGSNNRNFIYPAEGFNSERGVKVEIGSYASGDAKWYFDEIAVMPGEIYRYSSWYKATTGSIQTARFTVGNNKFVYKDLISLPATNGQWSPSESYFRIPAGASGLTVFHLINSVGSLITDNHVLQKVDRNPYEFTEGMVSLNFDDGLISIYRNAIPILNRYGLPSTQYINSGKFHDRDFVNASQVLQMQSLGHEIGAHTRSHSDLTQLTVEQMREEIIGNLNDLTEIGATVSTFAYPFGSYNSTTDAIVREAGFIGARTSGGGNNGKTDNKFLLRRHSIQRTTTLDQVQIWVDTAIAERRWAILLFHGIDYSDDTFSITPERFEQFVQYLVNRGVKIVTTKEGIELMQSL